MASLLSASALVAMALASLDTADTDTDSPPSNQTTRPFFAKPFLLGAHRGGKALWPENTLLAFTQAAAQWPDILLEGDARVTADGEVVLIHDGKIDRTTNGAGPISSMTLAEVKAFDAGYRFSRDGGKTFPYRGKGLTIPTFAEVLAALPDSRFLIELKGQTGVAESIVPVLRETGAVDRVALASHFAPLMQRARKLEPALIACYERLVPYRVLSSLDVFCGTPAANRGPTEFINETMVYIQLEKWSVAFGDGIPIHSEHLLLYLEDQFPVRWGRRYLTVQDHLELLFASHGFPLCAQPWFIPVKILLNLGNVLPGIRCFRQVRTIGRRDHRRRPCRGTSPPAIRHSGAPS